MGMPVTVTVRDGRAAAEPVFEWLREVDAVFSTYRLDSEISRIARGELAVADARPMVREVLVRCDALCGETRGYFDARAGGRRAPSGGVAARHAALDPSGFVKGWAVERAAELLEAAGSRDFCVDAGGDVVVRGGPWRVGIRHPRKRRRLAAVLTVGDLAVATSGAYERGAHILDPHTGRPPSGVLSVTVVGPDLATADAYATAAFAMGRRGPAWTATLDGYDAMTILGGGRVLSTPGLIEHCASETVAGTLYEALDSGAISHRLQAVDVRVSAH